MGIPFAICSTFEYLSFFSEIEIISILQEITEHKITQLSFNYHNREKIKKKHTQTQCRSNAQDVLSVAVYDNMQ